MPEPSPRTKPSRERLNGRDACWQPSLRVESAVRRVKPVMPSTWIMVWAPPETITSASPRRSRLYASPTAWVDAAHAVKQTLNKPLDALQLTVPVLGVMPSVTLATSRAVAAAAEPALWAEGLVLPAALPGSGGLTVRTGAGRLPGANGH